MPLRDRSLGGLQTIVIREYSRIVRIWGQTLVPSVVTATLYFVIFGSLIGRRVGPMAASTTGSSSRPA
jgi:ABC-2 type transport system permease protein